METGARRGHFRRQEQSRREQRRSSLIVVALLLGAGYVALDLYSAGEKDMLTVETRGLAMISALTKYRQESGAYPDTLDKLVPKYVPALGKCPNGEPIGYQNSPAGEYLLSCQKVRFKHKPYSYDSRTKALERD